ncbi:MAG: hypothetical protein CBE24_07630 [bacterium TMED264]|nr:MAG: hypothetical protein CBE24_07630 [bacterium TMED264]
MNAKLDNKKVAIILGFYNGNNFIDAQIKSILNQNFKNIDIFIFDDNSKKKLEFKKVKINNNKKPKIKITKRKENLGYAKNFLLGLEEVGKGYDFYAFSDQDDIWEKDKIARGIEALISNDSNFPKLYCSRTAYYNSECTKEIGASNIHLKKPRFANALLQNIVGGNTILMNNLARQIVIKTVKAENFISHDWWCYQIISGAGGEIIFDKNKTVRYRQHKYNLIGKNNGFEDIKSRILEFFLGKVKVWSDVNLKNLYNFRYLLTNENNEILENLLRARGSKNIFKKLNYYLKSGVFRQSNKESIIFAIGIIFNMV